MNRLPQSWIVELRSRLAEPPPRELPRGGGARSAVLVPLYVDAGELWVLLTRRRHDLLEHRSQIAFPGGPVVGDEDPWEAAVREAGEEIGLPADRVLHLGVLDETTTPGGTVIVPCVGAVPFPLEPTLERDEIDEVFAVPLVSLANPRMIEQRRVEIGDGSEEVTVYHVGRRQVWGVTAHVLFALLGRLGMAVAEE